MKPGRNGGAHNITRAHSVVLSLRVNTVQYRVGFYPFQGGHSHRNAMVRFSLRGLKAPEETAMRHSLEPCFLAQAVTVAGRPAVRL